METLSISINFLTENCPGYSLSFRDLVVMIEERSLSCSDSGVKRREAYAENIVEQDNRFIKKRVRSMEN
jgi:transposase-like protein